MGRFKRARNSGAGAIGAAAISRSSSPKAQIAVSVDFLVSGQRHWAAVNGSLRKRYSFLIHVKSRSPRYHLGQSRPYSGDCYRYPDRHPSRNAALKTTRSELVNWWSLAPRTSTRHEPAAILIICQTIWASLGRSPLQRFGHWSASLPGRDAILMLSESLKVTARTAKRASELV
jgi:hypothetical protein